MANSPLRHIDLGVNVDHVATIRQARRTNEPDPVIAAAMAQHGGADGITFHLREDRRHIQDRDVEVFMQTVTVKTNFELACADEVLSICCRLKPDWALLVPESREEVTTEGGLDVAGDRGRIAKAVAQIRDAGIQTSLFLDPEPKQIEAAASLGVDAIELHTGPYAVADRHQVTGELERLTTVGQQITDAGMRLHAGHGLTYANVRPVAAIPGMAELNIGHSIVSRAVMVGMTEAVAEMRRILDLI
ncbi:pyridoxine 5'-phosphate synthase [Neorhodopirellula lusitana]|uniref:Pyridoxine 5'-phosphate synthase n=1 Tax=Neorhodopirellula lusitana TaxID=445327 RepID=A0ABY1PVT5_9BACT|nr:pyridoxine 5'-phosphate synthase [Neorhodopirellula lusitana]SMP46142.1 pyridoxine 5'-phosphate synthase [Neorhodopirellula lusitana]